MNQPHKSSVLVLIGFFLPGVKAGGPIRTVANLVHLLGDEFEFSILTRDRDFLSQESYVDIEPLTWMSFDRARVIYLPMHRLARSLIFLLRSRRFDVLYINSFFDFWFSIFPLLLMKLGLLKISRVVVAPRGEFAESALSFKSFKKSLFLKFARFIGLHKNVHWQASTDDESDDIFRVQSHGTHAQKLHVKIASDLVVFEKFLPPEKYFIAGGICLCFVSRIVPIKNLIFAIEVLRKIDFPVRFDVYGFKEDGDYWTDCEALSLTLPPNVSFKYLGELAAAEVRPTIARYDILFVPTKGENFGHIFIEALSAGVPILLSDQTPWKNLVSSGVGWDIPLDDPGEFRRVLGDFCYNRDGYSCVAGICQSYAEKIASDKDALSANRCLFDLGELDV